MMLGGFLVVFLILDQIVPSMSLFVNLQATRLSRFHRLPALFVGDKGKFSSIKTKSAKNNKTPATPVVYIDDLGAIQRNIEPVISTLSQGGVGVICTDTCYSFVTPVTSLEGMKRLLRLKGITNQKKPLSILCKSLSMISEYTSGITDEKWAYKLLRSTLPGPYTFILPASKMVPKIVVEHHSKIRRIKRKEIGVRIPADDVCQAILQRLDVPLLCGSVPESTEDSGDLQSSSGDDDEEQEEDDDSLYVDAAEDGSTSQPRDDYMLDLQKTNWFSQVDFVVINGPRGLHGTKSLSTVVSLTTGEPVVLRRGGGEYDFSLQE